MAVLLLANKVISNSSGILICMYIFATVESLIRLIFNSVTSRYIRAITLKVERSRRFDRTSFGSTVSPPGWIKRAKWQAVGWKGRYIANRRWDAEAESCMKAKKRDSIGQLTAGWLSLSLFGSSSFIWKPLKGALITQLGRKGRLIYFQRHRWLLVALTVTACLLAQRYLLT